MLGFWKIVVYKLKQKWTVYLLSYKYKEEENKKKKREAMCMIL